jgi:hypothetical protein
MQMTMRLTQEEREEMQALKSAINEYPASVIPEKQERFTELFVRSLQELHSKSDFNSK